MRGPIAFALMLICAPGFADGLRDPMRPPAPAATPGAVIHDSLPAVSAIFVAGDARVAVVSGRLVRAGDEIGDGKIEAVSADGVIWRRRGVAHELLLPRPSARFKKPATGPARTDNGVP